MPRTILAFRVGKICGYRRNKVWYLCYHERGRRIAPESTRMWALRGNWPHK